MLIYKKELSMLWAQITIHIYFTYVCMSSKSLKVVSDVG